MYSGPSSANTLTHLWGLRRQLVVCISCRALRRGHRTRHRLAMPHHRVTRPQLPAASSPSVAFHPNPRLPPVGPSRCVPPHGGMVDVTRFWCALPLSDRDGGHHGAVLEMALHQRDTTMALVAEEKRCGSPTATSTDRRTHTEQTTAADPAQTALGSTGGDPAQSAHAAGGLPDDCASL